MAVAKRGSKEKPRTELSRDLGLFDVTMVGVAGMIGAGIFVLTGHAAGAAGPALLLAFAVNGVVTLLTGMTYAELGSAIPEAGGGYLWVKEGLPGANAFLAGWMSWFAHTVVGSVYALGFAAYFALLFAEYAGPFGHLLQQPLLQKALAVAIALTFVYINYRGASETGKAGNIVTVGKLLIIWGFVFSGLYAIAQHPELMANFVNANAGAGASGFTPMGIPGVLTAMGLTFIAFEGYEIIAQAGEEVKNPRANIPRAVFLAMLIVIPTYIAVAFVALGAYHVPEGWATTWQWLSGHDPEIALASAAKTFMGPFAVLLMIGAVLSTMSALNATTYSSTRVSFAMGRDRNLPDAFARIHPKTRIPHIALLASGALIIFMAVALPLEHVAAAADIMFLLLFLQVNMACITIRRKYGDKLHYGYLAPFFPYVQIVAIVLQLALIVFMFIFSLKAGIIASVWVLAGYGIFHFYASRREREKDLTPVIARETSVVDRGKFSVLVPVANPETAETLLTVANRLLRLEDGNLLLAHVITLPDQTPLSGGREFIEEARPLLDRVAEMAERMGMAPNTIVRLAHKPADAIIDTVSDTSANFAVLGWAGRSRDSRTVIGSTIDKIVKDANANVVVVRGDVQMPARRILVPVQHPQHGNLIAQFAAAMTTEEDSYIEMLHVVDKDTSSAERAAAARNMREAIRGSISEQVEATGASVDRLKRRFRIRIQAGDVVETINKSSKDFDLVIIGASRESWLRRKVWGDKTKRLSQLLDTPVMLVNMGTGHMKYSVSRFFQFFWDIDEE